MAKTREPVRTKRIRSLENVLRVAVPQLEKIEWWHDERGTPHLRGKYRHWRPQGAWQTEEQRSDGTLPLIGLLWAAMDDRGKGPVRLEEPERSLHPEIVCTLPQMLARAQRRTGRRIFLTTHSLELLRDEESALTRRSFSFPVPKKLISRRRDRIRKSATCWKAVVAR